MINDTPRLHRWILLLVVASCFLGIGNRGLFVPDEPREAAILLEMSQGRDFVVPHLAHEPFVEKPPLYYAVGATLYDVLGASLGVEAVAVLCSVLFGLGALLSVAVLARRWLDPDRAWLAVVLYALSTAFLEHSHYIRSDISLACMVAAAVASFSEAYAGGRRGALIAGGAFTGLALLAKGLLGPAMIFPAWAVLFVRSLRGKEARQPLASLAMWHLGALLSFLAFCLPWLIAFYVREDALFREWLIDNHFKRAAGTAGLGHDGGGLQPWFYLYTALGDTLPWTPLLGAWPIVALRARRSGSSRPIDSFLCIWMAGVLILLTASSTKRNLYLLPLLPAFALAAASAWPSSLSPRLQRVLRGTPLLALVVSLTVFLAPLALGPLVRPAPRWRIFLPDAGSVAHLAAGFLACGAGILAALQRRMEARSSAIGAALLGNALVLCSTLPAKAAYLDPLPQIAKLREKLSTDAELAYASYGLGEIQRGWLYLYGFDALSSVSLDRARAVLRGNDPRCRGLLVGRKSSLEELGTELAPILEINLDQEKKGNSALYVLVPPGSR
ncbi:MAG: glycosyltransferase family 39 protein [Planctomycetes bacterium]|nr:glycosyltransferase family 39 protein [Planctomycetota bacterium]